MASTHEEAQARLHQAGRNDPCPCGSGKKYKKCHMAADEAAVHAEAESLKNEAAGAGSGEAKPGKGSAAKPRPRAQGGAPAAKPSRDTRPKNLPRRRAV